MHGARTLLFLIAGSGSLAAQGTPASPPPPPTLPHGPVPDLREVAPGILEFHGVRLDKKNRRISFPGEVNQRDGLIEYVVVNEKGKTHESLIDTKIAPRDIHMALLLIGLDPKSLPQSLDDIPPDAIDSAYLHAAPKMKGGDVRISVAWMAGGKANEVPLEDWVFDLQTQKPMTEGPWTYNGSMIEDGAFLADEDLSIISVITDPTALANNPRDGYDNDQIWQVRTDKVPPLKTPVEVSITLADSPHPATP
jgi:hypothetical protein